MKFILTSFQNRNASSLLPLFEAADRATIRALPLAARRLAKRHQLPPSTARVIAELAGFHSERDR